ncbi:MAG: hypothetical protein ABFD08_09425 [Syntrophomonas sp.]
MTKQNGPINTCCCPFKVKLIVVARYVNIHTAACPEFIANGRQ